MRNIKCWVGIHDVPRIIWGTGILEGPYEIRCALCDAVIVSNAEIKHTQGASRPYIDHYVNEGGA